MERFFFSEIKLVRDILCNNTKMDEENKEGIHDHRDKREKFPPPPVNVP